MHYVVIYDFTDDRARARAARVLLDYGMTRIQYSAFVGELEPRRARSLLTDLRKIVSSARGDRRVVHLFPVPVSSLRGVIVLGESPWAGEGARGSEVI